MAAYLFEREYGCFLDKIYCIKYNKEKVAQEDSNNP